MKSVFYLPREYRNFKYQIFLTVENKTLSRKRILYKQLRHYSRMIDENVFRIKRIRWINTSFREIN